MIATTKSSVVSPKSAVVIMVVGVAIALIDTANAFAPPSFSSVAATTATTATGRGCAAKSMKLHQSSRALDYVEEISSIPTTRSAKNEEEEKEGQELAFGMPQVGISPNLPPATVDTFTTTRQFTPFQHFARITPLATIGAYSVHPEPFDTAVEQVWKTIYNWDIAHTGLFEAHVASFSFVASIAAWSVAHLILGEKKAAQSRLDGQLPKEDPLAWADITTWEDGIRLWLNPLVSYLASIWIYQQIFHTHQPLPMLAPSFGVLVCEVFFGVFLYDLLFFPVHWAMHKAPIKAIRGVHGYHHRHTNGGLNSIETVQHSFIDGTLQVMVNILVQHISPFGGPKHMLSRIIHNIMVTYMLAESHSGYNLPWMCHNIWPEFLGGAPRHDRHHHDGRVYYQQFFMYLDDAMGLTDQEVQDQLKQKGAERLKLLQRQQQQQIETS